MASCLMVHNETELRTVLVFEVNNNVGIKDEVASYLCCCGRPNQFSSFATVL
jgi:hypothetical protein